MKKLICLLVSALMFFSVACAENVDVPKVVNPQGYTMIEVSDYWYDDDGCEHNIQGAFGDYIPELQQMEGFDPLDVYTLTLAPDAVIALPNAAGEVVPATIAELDAYIDVLRQSSAPISVFCSFEMDDAGTLTKLVYSIPGEQTGDSEPLSPEYYNPNNYTLMKVEDAYQCDDDDYVVLASFGECDYTDESSPVWQGFDPEESLLIVVAPDAVIEMSANLDDEDNVPMTVEEFTALVAQVLTDNDGKYAFYCEFDMNDEGVLTRLTYFYLPY